MTENTTTDDDADRLDRRDLLALCDHDYPFLPARFEDDDGNVVFTRTDVATDGGHAFRVNPESCPECADHVELQAGVCPECGFEADTT